ncbi:hypothetical protein [Phaffia rhodozyma]|uniref:Uncharacterized protein n=1 Tax=Phaffia rhodozyma TaxID=264483 RepID=A0A0F7SIT8_PHARH|nr:hypothetical protein [Phaffia rhodozyma]
MESLPPLILKKIIFFILTSSARLIPILLASLGKKVHEATKSVVFERIDVELPACKEDNDSRNNSIGEIRERGKWKAVLGNPARYASSVRMITVHPPLYPQLTGSPSIFTSIDQGELEIFLPLVLACKENLDRILWRGIGVWGDQVGEQLLNLPKLKHLSLVASPLSPASTLTQHQPNSIPRFNLPHPIPSQLETLELSRLSVVGTKNLSLHLTTLPRDASLEKISIESALMDDQLCELITKAGRGVKNVWLRTSGTKLTDKGILAILEDCPSLESFCLSEVQGRLSKTLWSKVEVFPETLRHLRIEISDVGPHHSWTTDHLLSISDITVNNLETFSVVRSIPPVCLFPVPPQGHPPPRVDEACIYGPLPDELLCKICDKGTRLKVLELDWWTIGKDALEKITKKRRGLEKLRVTFDAPFGKLLAMTTAFSHLPQLQVLHVSIPPSHLPLPQAITLPPTTPPLSTSPLLPKATLPHLLSDGTPLDQPIMASSQEPDLFLSHYGSSSTSSLSSAEEDDHLDLPKSLNPLLWQKSIEPTIPLLKDVKKFMRRVPKLIELGWVGRSGVGFWIAGTGDLHPFESGQDLNRGTRSTGSTNPHGCSGGIIPNGTKHRRASTSSAAPSSSSIFSPSYTIPQGDVEFLSLALLWRNEWEEASRGLPEWSFGEEDLGLSSPVMGNIGIGKVRRARRASSTSSSSSAGFGMSDDGWQSTHSPPALISPSSEISSPPPSLTKSPRAFNQGRSRTTSGCGDTGSGIGLFPSLVTDGEEKQKKVGRGKGGSVKG